MSEDNYARAFANALQNYDGNTIAIHLSIRYWGLIELSKTNESDLENSLDQHYGNPEWYNEWTEVALTYLKITSLVVGGSSPKDVYLAQNQLLSLVNRIAEKSDNWILPVLYTVAKELRQLATHAGMDCLEEAARPINRCFTICLNDRNLESSESRNLGVMYFVGELMKVYFKLKKRDLAKSVLKVLINVQSTSQIPPDSAYPKSHLVTMYYYRALLDFINEDYVAAEKRLSTAYNLCSSYIKDTNSDDDRKRRQVSIKKNMQSILLYWIPCKFFISKGKVFPNSTMLNDFPIFNTLYNNLFTDVIRGNVKAFELFLKENRLFLAKKRLIPIIYKLKELCIFYVFRRTYVFLGKSNRVSIDMFAKSLKGATLGPNHIADVDEPEDNNMDGSDDDSNDWYSSEQVEGFLASFINTNLMKGYISRAHKMVVLSNTSAFPLHPATTN